METTDLIVGKEYELGSFSVGFVGCDPENEGMVYLKPLNEYTKALCLNDSGNIPISKKVFINFFNPK